MLQNVLTLTLVIVVFTGCFGNNQSSTPLESQIDDTNSDSASQDISGNQIEEEVGVIVGEAELVPRQEILDNLAESNDHTSLISALIAAEVVEPLMMEGPYTVFAPTNEAFELLPEGELDRLLLPENKDELAAILNYHVLPGALTSTDFTDEKTVETVQGAPLTLSEINGDWYVNDSNKITIPDVFSSNGVIHVIDTVLIP